MRINASKIRECALLRATHPTSCIDISQRAQMILCPDSTLSYSLSLQSTTLPRDSNTPEFRLINLGKNSLGVPWDLHGEVELIVVFGVHPWFHRSLRFFTFDR